ncbi:TonB-dependent receptor [Peristeroidobacter agariperforans]|uniref:TonB-dependent receptor n=1 Tax=Peristeroidobacter agariperforans TaxID=268404 RepID=UPI0018E5118F|nr:TonB-dependent receptor [Peristeroidobacter agariperforans]
MHKVQWATGGVCALALASNAFAQVSEQTAIEIESGNLAQSLTALGRQTQTELVFDPTVVADRKAPSVRGSMTADQALEYLLSGTGLRHERTSSDVVLVLASAQQSSSAPSERAQEQPAEDSGGYGGGQESASTSEPVLESITVVGIRKSIADAIEVKREATRIMDSISAEDIGKLPDQNIAETLSRIPGVQVTRVEGEGKSITVRGLGLNKLLLNGKSFIGSARNGDPNLSDVSPELLAGVDVIKAPSADLVEGWLGAVINLRTKRPLDLADSVISGRLQSSYADRAEEWGEKVSGFVAHTFADRKFGVLLSGSYSNSTGASDVYQSGSWTRVSNVDATGDGVNDTFFRPLRLMSWANTYEDERYSVNASAQWRPIDELTFTLEGVKSRRETDRLRSTQQAILTNNITNGVIDASGTLVSGNFSGVTVRPLIYGGDSYSDNEYLSGNVHWAKDRWTANFNASVSEGDGAGLGGDGGNNNSGNDNVLVARQRAGNLASVSYDAAGSNVSPNYGFDANYDIYDPSQYEIYTTFDVDYVAENKGHDADFDVEYELDGFFKSVKVGARTENIEVFGGNPLSSYPALSSHDPTPGSPLLATEVPGLNYSGVIGGMFPGESGSFPRRVLTGSADFNQIRSALGATPISFDTPGAKATINQVEQTTDAFFAMVRFGSDVFGVPMTGDLGVRQVNVDRESFGYTIVGNQAIEARAGKSFSDTLPNLNLIFDLRDDLRLRFAAAKVVARPDLTSTGVGISLQPVSMTGFSGNPDLDPFRATQFDTTVEWYFAPASLIAVGAFYKDVSAFTTSVEVVEEHPEAPNNTLTGPAAYTYIIGRPVNGKDGKIQGVEVNYQHALTMLPQPFDGFGYAFTYTYADSETPEKDELTGQTLPIPNSSEHSANAVVYYEKGPFSGRVAYNYRSEYMTNGGSIASGGSNYADARGQVDASASFRINDNFQLTFEGVNLTREINSFYRTNPGRLYSSYLDDRRIYFGVAATF